MSERRDKRTFSLRVLKKGLVIDGVDYSDEIPTNEQRPTKRNECPDYRPCPWVGCPYHNGLDVNDSGSITIARHDCQPWELAHSCALDVANIGDHTLEEVGHILNVTRERIRQIEDKAKEKLFDAAKELGISIGNLGLDSIKCHQTTVYRIDEIKEDSRLRLLQKQRLAGQECRRETTMVADIKRSLTRAVNEDTSEMGVAERIQAVEELQELVAEAEKKIQEHVGVLSRDKTLQRIMSNLSNTGLSNPKQETAKPEVRVSDRQRVRDWCAANPGRCERPVNIAVEACVPRKAIATHLSKLNGSCIYKVGDGTWQARPPE